MRLIKPGNKNTQVTEAIEQVAAAFGVNAVAGVESSQLLPFQVRGGGRGSPAGVHIYWPSRLLQKQASARN